MLIIFLNISNFFFLLIFRGFRFFPGGRSSFGRLRDMLGINHIADFNRSGLDVSGGELTEMFTGYEQV